VEPRSGHVLLRKRPADLLRLQYERRGHAHQGVFESWRFLFDQDRQLPL
jgi:hypothetical protein